jgi:hypothetical protein
MTRGLRLVLAGSIALLVAILAVAVNAAYIAPGPGGDAARLVPATALAFVRLSTDRDDPAARRLARLAPRIPGYLAVRDAALTAVSPAPGAFDLRRDVRPWLGDEAAVALLDLGGGRFGSLVLAEVRNRPRAEALLQRVAGERPATRYGATVVRRFGTNAAAFVRGFLVAGPVLAVERAIDVASGDARPLAGSPPFERALAGARRPAEAYLSARGLRGFVRARGGIVGAIAAALDHPRVQGLGAALGADTRGLRVRLRRVGTGGPQVTPALAERVPGGAIALLAGADLRAALAAAQRAGAGPTLDSVRTTLREGASLDLDRGVIGRLDGGFAAWLAPGDAAPVIGLAARTSDPRGVRDALARLQIPVAQAFAEDADAPRVFSARKVGRADAFTLEVSDGFAPTYAVTGDTVVAATSPAGVEAFLDRRIPRLARAPVFRSALPDLPSRVESLGFIDVRQLLALGAQTGLTAGDFRPVRAASAVTQREEDDTTAELFFEIP